MRCSVLFAVPSDLFDERAVNLKLSPTASSRNPAGERFSAGLSSVNKKSGCGAAGFSVEDFPLKMA